MPFTDDPLNGFIRSLDAGGMVMGVTSSGSVVPQTVASPRSDQQLFHSYQDSADSSQNLECQSNKLFLQATAGGSLVTAQAKSGEKGQQWWLSPDGHLYSEAMGNNVLAIRNGAYAIVASDPNDVTQKFEFIWPAAEFYIRHCRSGFFLTAGANNSVSWTNMSDRIDASQRWYTTPSQRVMSRATGKVLEASGTAPGSALSLGDALAVGPGSVLQAFYATSGSLRSLATGSLPVGGAPAAVTLVALSPSDSSQEIELISPFSFFLLQSNLPQPAGAPPVDLWLKNDREMVRTRTGEREQLFSVSRFGQIFNADRGLVAYFQTYTSGQPSNYLDFVPMTMVAKEMLPQVTFQFEGEILPSGARGLIRFPANMQLCSVVMVSTTPLVALSNVVNDPSQAVQYWNVVDPLDGAMRFFMDDILTTFSSPPEAFPG